MLTKDILPNNPVIDGLKFRTDHLYTPRVHEIFRKNDQPLKRLFDECHDKSTKFMSPEECILLCKKA